jgi:NADPH:quinone reductase
VIRAIVIEKFGGPDCLVYKDLPEPEPLVVMSSKSRRLTSTPAEMHKRRGEWG